jgi:hypothetical protein
MVVVDRIQPELNYGWFPHKFISHQVLFAIYSIAAG